MDTPTPETKARLLRLSVDRAPLWIPVEGFSMGPTLSDGDEVMVVVASRPRPGQIWAFCDSEGNVVVHRSVTARREGFIFRGDARASTDPLVPSRRLIGRVARFRSDGGGERSLSVAAGLWRVGRWRLAGALRRVGRPLRARLTRK